MEPLQSGKYYHIYNRSNNREDLFRTPANYQHFLRLYEKYILPIADTFAWVLMKNHFHMLVRIRDEEEIEFLPSLDAKHEASRFTTVDASRSVDAGRSGGETFQRSSNLEVSGRSKRDLKKPIPSHQFSHLFNAYAKYYNKLNNRTGSLFQKNFKRKEVNSDRYFRQLVVYIHTNPVHHGFTDNFKDYPWSSFATILSLKPTKLSRDEVIGWFDDVANFVYIHNQEMDRNVIESIEIE